MRAPDETQYKGYPVIVVYTGKEYNGEDEKIMLGVRKAAAICDNIDYIRRFVEKHTTRGKG